MVVCVNFSLTQLFKKRTVIFYALSSSSAQTFWIVLAPEHSTEYGMTELLQEADHLDTVDTH